MLTNETHDALPEPQRPVDLDALDALAKAANAADLACEFARRTPWTAQAADPRFPYLDQEIVGSDGEVVARLLHGPELAAFIAAASPDVVRALTARVRELEAANAQLTEALNRCALLFGLTRTEVMHDESGTGNRIRYFCYEGKLAVRDALDAALATEAQSHAE